MELINVVTIAPNDDSYLSRAPHVMRISEKFSRSTKTERNWRKGLKMRRARTGLAGNLQLDPVCEDSFL